LFHTLQRKYLPPRIISITPITIVMAPATRSPRRRAFIESKDAEKPVRKSAGKVPRPKRSMVANPRRRLAVVAALTIMARESIQGRNPERIPSASLDGSPFDEKRR